MNRYSTEYLSREARIKRIGEILAKGVALMHSQNRSDGYQPIRNFPHPLNNNHEKFDSPPKLADITESSPENLVVLNFIRQRREVSPKDIQDFLSCSRSTVFRKLKSLQKSGLVDKNGQIDIAEGVPFLHTVHFTNATHPIPAHHVSLPMYRRQALIDGGGSPTYYSTLGFREETDLCLRILTQGYRIFFIPNAIAWHFPAHTGGFRDEAMGALSRKRMQDHKKFSEIWGPKLLEYLKGEPNAQKTTQ